MCRDLLPSGLIVLAAIVVLAAPLESAAEAPIPLHTGPHERFDVRDFGAKGDGVTDDSTAFQKALDAIIEAKRGTMCVPAGTYLLKQCVAKEFEGAHGTGIAVTGEGRGVSVMICANTEGALKIHDTFCRTQVHIRDLSFFAGIQGAGTAIEVSSPPRGVRNYRTCTVKNVEVRGLGVPTWYYFDRGYAIIGQWRPLLTDCVFSGILDPKLKNDPDYDRDADDSLFFKPEYGFCADWSYAPSFQNCYAWSCHTGYRVVSEDLRQEGPEDLAFYRSFAVGCRIGIHIDTPIKEPQLVIDACHINCRDTGILLRHRKFFHIVNCLMYSETGEKRPYTDIDIGDCYAGRISGNQFHSPSRTNRKKEPPSKRTGIRITETSSDLIITGNTFNAKGAAITVADGAKHIQGSDNAAMNPWTTLPDAFK